jgi:amidase
LAEATPPTDDSAWASRLGRCTLPIAIKDWEDTAGIRTTYGSRLFADHVPEADFLVVARLRAVGAIVVGETNTPEMGVGSHTFNEVFGVTRNPWSLDRSAGGSSGGAGAALASGMLPIADGSDHGGSVRDPASFNNVVGLRPTPRACPESGGRRPVGCRVGRWSDGAIGRRPRADAYRDCRERFTGAAVARGPGGVYRPTGCRARRPAGSVVARCWRAADRARGGHGAADARRQFVALGADVGEVDLDVNGADEAFETMRALGFASLLGPQLSQLRGIVKDTIIWNVE